MNRLLAVLPAMVLLVSVSGCTTLFNGRSQNVQLKTSPSGAQCAVGDQSVITPATVRLSNTSRHRVQCQLPGYQPATADLNQALSGWLFADILVWPTLIIDYAVGSYHKLIPEDVELVLNPVVGQPVLGSAMAASLTQTQGSQPAARIAVLTFDSHGTPDPIEGAAIESAVLDSGFKVVDRSNLDLIMKEQKLSLTGAVRARDAQTIGQLSGAQLMIVWARAADEASGSMRLLSISDGDVLGSVQCFRSDLPRCVHQILKDYESRTIRH